MVVSVITTSCPCGWTFEVPEKRVGQETMCPGCGRYLVIQGGRSLENPLARGDPNAAYSPFFSSGVADGTCPFCRGQIEPGVLKCRHCSEWLQPDLRKAHQPPKWHRGTAAALSLIPGMGQIYKGRVARGLLWLPATVLGYAAYVVPGLILHVLCILNAYHAGDPRE